PDLGGLQHQAQVGIVCPRHGRFSRGTRVVVAMSRLYEPPLRAVSASRLCEPLYTLRKLMPCYGSARTPRRRRSTKRTQRCPIALPPGVEGGGARPSG